MAGYSGTPLPKKLGIATGATVLVVRAPDAFVDSTLQPLPDHVTVRTAVGRTRTGTADVVVSFHTARADFEKRLPSLLDALDVDGGLWIAWPKRASKVPTDMTEDTVREVCLPVGLVDNKVCAIDEVWSGLRVVWRKELRPDLRARRQG